MNTSPAFPSYCPVEAQYAFSGISERKYVALMAMQGWLSSYGPEDALKIPQLVETAFAIADEFLKYDD